MHLLVNLNVTLRYASQNLIYTGNISDGYGCIVTQKSVNDGHNRFEG